MWNTMYVVIIIYIILVLYYNVTPMWCIQDYMNFDLPIKIQQKINKVCN